VKKEPVVALVTTTSSASDTGRFGQFLRRVGLAGPIEYLFQVLHGLCHPRLLTSGAAAADRVARLAGDEVVPDATWIRTRAQTVDAGAEDVWPWLAQLGANRGGWPGWYPFTHPHDTSADEVLGFTVAAGDTLLEVVGSESTACWHVVDTREPHHLVLHSCRTLGTGQDVDRTRATHWADISWAFVIEPQEDGRVRLLARTRSAVAPLWVSFALRIIGVGDNVMQRELLATIARRAERKERMARCLSRNNRPGS
jgi:hypothetical protein